MSKKLVREAGFTYVELLCVLSIMGLLTSFAMPDAANVSMRFSNEKLRLEVISGLQQAQLVAMAKEKEISVYFSENNMFTFEDEKVIRILHLPDEIQIESNYKNNTVVFQETGQVRGGTIILRRPENKMKIRVLELF